MPLPSILASIFKSKQRTYKMILVLSLLEEQSKVGEEAPLVKVSERFRDYYLNREKQGLIEEKPPKGMASSWERMGPTQIRRLLETPINALSHVLMVDEQKDSINFRPEIPINSSVIDELKSYANQEIEIYYQLLKTAIPLRDHLLKVMSTYVKAKREPFKGHFLGALMRQTIPSDLQRLSFIDERYKIQGSVGQGGWANIPWIAIMDKTITNTTQRGEYVCYLFSESMESVYLTLQLGVTEPLNEKGRKAGYEYLQTRVREMRQMLSLEPMKQDENIFLTKGGLGNDYQVSTVAYIRYDLQTMPINEELIADLSHAMEIYQLYVDIVQGKDKSERDTSGVKEVSEDMASDASISPKARLEEVKLFIQNKGFSYPAEIIENFYLSLKTKPFVILAGISGTGKTKLVKLFAEAIGATESNGQFMLIPVRPDWSDPSDLLGYTDLAGNFRPGKFSKLLALASRDENKDKPYFVCLDEMNLARVEHYFSDLLSIMETRHWSKDRILTDHVLSLDDQDGFAQEEYRDLIFPDNVYVVGTVNMDETTHPFSKKVLDRAQTIEFSYIDLAHFPISTTTEKPQMMESEASDSSSNSFLRSDYITLKDAYYENEALIRRSTERLVDVNLVLETIYSQVGFRVRDEVRFYLLYNDSYGLMTEDQAFDLQLLQKILPRLQGSSSSVKRALIQLMFLALGTGGKLEEMLEDASSLYLPWQVRGVLPKAKFPWSARKLAYVLRRLEEDGFTSFWLS